LTNIAWFDHSLPLLSTPPDISHSESGAKILRIINRKTIHITSTYPQSSYSWYRGAEEPNSWCRVWGWHRTTARAVEISHQVLFA